MEINTYEMSCSSCRHQKVCKYVESIESLASELEKYQQDHTLFPKSVQDLPCLKISYSCIYYQAANTITTPYPFTLCSSPTPDTQGPYPKDPITSYTYTNNKKQ